MGLVIVLVIVIIKQDGEWQACTRVLVLTDEGRYFWNTCPGSDAVYKILQARSNLVRVYSLSWVSICVLYSQMLETSGA